MARSGNNNNQGEDDMTLLNFDSARIGMKTVDMKGHTGTVTDIQRSSHTQTTVDYDRRTTTQSTTHYIDFTLALEDGRTMNISTQAKYAPVNKGDVVTGFWGEVRGKERPSYLAFYNHTTGALGINAEERNFLAGPVGHAYLMIVCVFLGMFGVMGLFRGGPDIGSIISTLICAAFFYHVFARRKKLLGLVHGGIERLKAGPRFAPAADAAAG